MEDHPVVPHVRRAPGSARGVGRGAHVRLERAPANGGAPSSVRSTLGQLQALAPHPKRASPATDAAPRCSPGASAPTASPAASVGLHQTKPRSAIGVEQGAVAVVVVAGELRRLKREIARARLERAVFSDLPVPGALPERLRFGFSARTGAACEEHWVDDILITGSF